jgi:hypothetical protein
MLHKIRKAMGSRDSLYKLGGNIEMDEGIYPKYLKMQVIPDCISLHLCGNAEFKGNLYGRQN